MLCVPCPPSGLVRWWCRYGGWRLVRLVLLPGAHTRTHVYAETDIMFSWLWLVCVYMSVSLLMTRVCTRLSVHVLRAARWRICRECARHMSCLAPRLRHMSMGSPGVAPVLHHVTLPCDFLFKNCHICLRWITVFSRKKSVLDLVGSWNGLIGITCVWFGFLFLHLGNHFNWTFLKCFLLCYVHRWLDKWVVSLLAVIAISLK